MSIRISVEIKVEDIARAIKRMEPVDKEMLFLLLSGQGKEIAKRLKEIKTKKVKTLSREEMWKDDLQA